MAKKGQEKMTPIMKRVRRRGGVRMSFIKPTGVPVPMSVSTRRLELHIEPEDVLVLTIGKEKFEYRMGEIRDIKILRQKNDKPSGKTRKSLEGTEF